MDGSPRRKWPDLGWRRKRLRLAGFDYADPHYVFFVTLCARQLRDPFSAPALAKAVTEAVLFRDQMEEWRVYAYCLMPDHLHMALSVRSGDSLSLVLQRFKSYTTRLAWQQGLRGTLWQRSYYDHVARREEDVLAMCRYILENPVRRGLVGDGDLWPYSGMPRPLPG